MIEFSYFYKVTIIKDMFKTLITILAFVYSFQINSQIFEVIPPDYIKTIQLLSSENEFNGTPIIQLGTGFTLSFDDIRATEEDYYFVIEHFDYDWTPSKLSKNEYLEGFDNQRIFDYLNSFNTLQPYSHYELQIPNENVRRINVSGNYKIKILNYNGDVVFSRRFIVYENLANVPVEIRRSRNLDYIREKQVVYFSVNSENLIFRNPNQTINATIIQNNDLNEAIYGLKPQYTSGNDLIYRYDEEASFWGGNEYLFFDNSDIRLASRGIQRIELGEKLYNTHLRPHGSRANSKYIFNPDINGGFKINTQQGIDERREAEYAWVHFKLNQPKNNNGGEFHLYGRFNNYVIDNNTYLKFNESSGFYETKLMLKQGFYNFKYVYLNPEGKFDSGYISGNHDITENDYTVLIYYRDIGARFDRLVGVGSGNSRNIIN